jgi:DNA-binding SARP family transcriptional activator/predicted ATPase
MPAEGRLELRLLGEMAITRSGEPLVLPPSRKTRALLAYLALTGRSHRRERLCSLLWDVADDPRGALRWSLSRLRALVDEPEQPRIRAGRDNVAFAPEGARVDILALRQRCATGLETLTLDDLRSLVAEFRGELLEGLDLADFLDFQAWCVAEREEARKLHATLLRTLVARLADDPEAALPHARALAAVDPLDEPARAGLVRLLAVTGRWREAEGQYEAARRLLRDLGGQGSGELEAAWRSAPGAIEAARRPETDGAATPTPSAAVSGLVGRQDECRRLAALLEEATRQRSARAVLLTGEPGLGKSRLLAELATLARAGGGSLLEGRAFEAESGPFGPWVDALRQLPPGSVRPALAADLGALLPELARDDGAPPSRDRLFAAVVTLLSELAAAAPPVVLAIDDVHLLDTASAELLHYVTRTCRHRPLVVALAARAGELHDNETALRTVRSLREMGLLAEMPLAALGREATRELVRAAAPEVDADEVYAESGGNPLFALEVARFLPEREGPMPRSLVEIIRHRVARLPAEAGDVLRWAVVLGHGFDASLLGELADLDLDRLLGSLELLERHALLRAQSEGAAPGGYDFAHELVRRAVYSDISQPRRRLMHLRVAERLGKVEAAETVAASLAHHAALAGESALAARACVRAGRLFLRQFANAEAWAVARRGRRHAAEVAEPARTGLVLELLQVELQARRPQETAATADELGALAERALDLGDAEHARLGFHMLSYLRWEEGDLSDAQRHMLRAEAVSRAGDERARITAMAEAARCLVLLERDLPRAEALALEAGARAARAGLRPSAVADAQGMLRQHQGRFAEAEELFEEARLEARGAGSAMDEFQALEHHVVLFQQQGDWTAALRLARDLAALGEKLREGSEAPFARALLALSRHALGEEAAEDALDAALDELRGVDAKQRLAYALTRAARLDLEQGRARRARERAEEARRAAEALGRPSETILAKLTLVRACRQLELDAEAGRLLDELRTAAGAATSQPLRLELAGLLRENRARASGRRTATRQEERG